MSFDKIQLPDFLLADLYKSTLVDLQTFSVIKEPVPAEIAPLIPIETKTESDALVYLGENAKHVTIVVNEPEAVYLPEADLAFLVSVLKACQLNLADISIVNTARRAVTYQDFKSKLASRQVLLFNVEPTAIKLPFMIPAFQIQRFDECTIMLAPALSVINQATTEGKLLKTKLWMSLKQVFGI